MSSYATIKAARKNGVNVDVSEINVAILALEGEVSTLALKHALDMSQAVGASKSAASDSPFPIEENAEAKGAVETFVNTRRELFHATERLSKLYAWRAESAK